MSEEELLDSIDPDILKIYKKKSVLELKNELRTHNYKLSGNKGELINRLLINLKHIN
jgi:hypothetical protein